MGKSLIRRARDYAYWRGRRLVSTTRYRIYGYRVNRRFEREGPDVDPRIRYPSYKSLDDLLDVERLRGLDGFVREQVARYLRERDCEPFHTGALKRGVFSRFRPGSRLIQLSVMKEPGDYFLLNEPDRWEVSPVAEDFGPLMDFIETLPFARRARMIIMCDDRGRSVTAHRDHPFIDRLHEFVWFRTNLDKPFWVQDVRSGEREYLSSHTAWFDTVNQFHGADPIDKLSISIRVDGEFTDEFRARIPVPEHNRASTASLWASVGDAVPGDARGAASTS